MIDLHIHTNASADGQYPPDIIVAMAAKLGLTAIAFADHNTIDSVLQGRELCRRAGIDFLESIELNTDFDGRDLHLLAYGFDPENPAFDRWLAQIAEKGEQKSRQWAENLRALGLAIEYDDVVAFSPGRLPTGSSYLRALAAVEKNRAHPLVAPYIEGGEKADNPYVNFYYEVLAEGPVATSIKSLTTADAIEQAHRFGALAVLAHPADLPGKITDALIDAGLDGVEAVSSYHDEATNNRYLALAKEKGILPTAGSDFHGPDFKKHVKLGGITPNERWMFEGLMERLGR